MSKSTKWFLLILGVLLSLGVFFTIIFLSAITGTTEKTEEYTSGSGEKIGVIELTGVITSSDDVVRQLKKYREKSSIKGILLRVETPGGGVVASQEMYEEVRKTRDAGKPVVVSMGAVAASGGYYVACGSSRIVANRGSLTGSIGVISEFLQLQDALQKLGVSVKMVKSGKMKDAGSPVRKMTELDEQYLQGIMDNVHEQFIGVVAHERKMNRKDVLKIADGRVFTGLQALDAGLVDTIGTFEDAIQITASLAGIDGEPAVVRERKRRGVWNAIFGDVAESMNDWTQFLLNKPILSYRLAVP